MSKFAESLRQVSPFLDQPEMQRTICALVAKRGTVVKLKVIEGFLRMTDINDLKF